jgi:hypothetical protein
VGSKLIRQTISRLIAEVDPITQGQIRRLPVEMTSEAGVEFQGLRHGNAGNTNWVEFHLPFPKDTSFESAHCWRPTLKRESNKTRRSEPK